MEQKKLERKNMDNNGFGMIKLHLKGSLLKEHDVADLLQISIPKLRKERKNGNGIPYYKLNGSVRYSVKDIKSYLRVSRKKFEVNPPTDKKDSERDLSWSRHFYPYHDKEGAIVFLNEVNPNDKDDQVKWGRVG